MHFHVIKIAQYFCDNEDGVVDGFMRALLREKREKLMIIQRVNE